ncbi:S-adenosyl-L-methionine-dependent methyltransferase [Xylona heveae TC161]|uniref:S-adenosyl-L-methionine-dependent methyltransferase n=1 Tax=Xylona heveae (strain CBS 132557 / TC161) TaxID=1328760 RepID=A0A165HEW8_XYLHT|nr:S-adenosyl-L-methionine-dependent methyltransferase [Xylona heveae TC161]KZF23408.1 S-adenosyl-L-methionine-dependent methyltransferase [Xylona heveae TC161]
MAELPITADPAVEGFMEPDLSDEGYAESSASTYVTSIASDIRRGVEENGRTYPVYGKNEYGMPVDDKEQDRLDLQHCKYTLLLENKLFLSPIPEKPQKILDLGTGTGIWAIDVADTYPSAQVIGTDLAPVQPTWVPTNCQFEIDDAEDDWVYAKDNFDLIHGRDFTFAIRNWTKLIHQSYEHLKPGGYLELSCVYPVPKCDDGTLPPDSAYVEVSRTYNEMAKLAGCPADSPLHYKEWMEKEGFEDVKEVIYRMPTSPWPKDKRLKKIGGFEKLNLLEGAQGFLVRGFTGVLGRTREELELLLARLREELRTPKFHSYVPFYVVYGRKPGASSAA